MKRRVTPMQSTSHDDYWHIKMAALRREYHEARPHAPGAGIHHFDRDRPYMVHIVGF